MVDLRDKVIMITGSSSGIGEGIAVHLARLGSKLTLTGRNKDNLLKVVDKCIHTGLDESKIICVDGDITSGDVRETLIKKTLETFGRLDVLVNNAGLFSPGNSTSTTEQQYDETMAVNLKSVFFLTQLAIPHLKKSKGNIINISSNSTQTPFSQIYTYCMSKAALDMYSKCLAVELGPSGVRVNSISPGPVISMIRRRGESPLVDETAYKKVMERTAANVPIRRVGQAEDIAKAVEFLASNERSSYISGEIMFIDGAMRWKPAAF